MQAQIDIKFEQLVQLVKRLPIRQWAKLKWEVEKEQNTTNTSELEEFLLAAPTFNKEQLDEIAKARKEISQWRTR